MKSELPSVTIDGEECRAMFVPCFATPRPMTEEHLATLLAALPDEQKGRLIGELMNISPRYAEMIDDESAARASKIFDMSDEEFDAEIRECGGDPERLTQWGSAMGRWIRELCVERAKVAALQRELEQERAGRVRAEARCLSEESWRALNLAFDLAGEQNAAEDRGDINGQYLYAEHLDAAAKRAMPLLMRDVRMARANKKPDGEAAK